MRHASGTSDLLKAREVADEYRVSVATVHRWRRRSGLEAIRVGRTVRFRRSDVEAFLAEASREQAS